MLLDRLIQLLRNIVIGILFRRLSPTTGRNSFCSPCNESS